MTRDQQPVSEAEIEEARAGLQELRQQVREDLAADLGGDPEDYNADRVDEVRPDGGE